MDPLLPQSMCVDGPFLNSQSRSHRITRSILQGGNSSHKTLKHYLGGRKQLDSLESDASRQAATGKGGLGRKTELRWGGRRGHSVQHYKVHLTVSTM